MLNHPPLQTAKVRARGRAKRAIRWLAARRFPRYLLNRVYGKLSTEQKAGWHARFSKLFRDYDAHFSNGNWFISFCGKPLKIPLTKEFAWLEWDAAFSILGHEIEIKQTYECLLSLPSPPRVVFDVGANYGTHSILFLVRGVLPVSFEPNPRCHPFFKKICELNGLHPTIEPLAVGAREGTATLWFPEKEEWLGTTKASVKEHFEPRAKVEVCEVIQTTIDAYSENHALIPHLIKIDTEGADLDVLQGSSRTLAAHRPLVIFESWKGEERTALLSFLTGVEYRICNLPVRQGSSPEGLSKEEFLHSDRSNFMAMPEAVFRTWPPKFP